MSEEKAKEEGWFQKLNRKGGWYVWVIIVALVLFLAYLVYTNFSNVKEFFSSQNFYVLVVLVVVGAVAWFLLKNKIAKPPDYWELSENGVEYLARHYQFHELPRVQDAMVERLGDESGYVIHYVSTGHVLVWDKVFSQFSEGLPLASNIGVRRLAELRENPEIRKKKAEFNLYEERRRLLDGS